MILARNDKIIENVICDKRQYPKKYHDICVTAPTDEFFFGSKDV